MLSLAEQGVHICFPGECGQAETCCSNERGGTMRIVVLWAQDARTLSYSGGQKLNAAMHLAMVFEVVSLTVA